MGSLANFAFLVFVITFVGYHVKAHDHDHDPRIRVILEEHLGHGHVHFERKHIRPDTRVSELKNEFSNRHHCPEEHVVVKYRDRIVTQDVPLQTGGHQDGGREHDHGGKAHGHGGRSHGDEHSLNFRDGETLILICTHNRKHWGH